MFDEARKLTPAEREELAALLLGSLAPDPTVEQAWADEAKRRWQAHVASDEQSIDALAAIEDACRRLAKSRKA